MVPYNDTGVCSLTENEMKHTPPHTQPHPPLHIPIFLSLVTQLKWFMEANTKEDLQESENQHLGDEELATSLLLSIGELLDQLSCSWVCLQDSVCSANHLLKAHSGRDKTQLNRIK